MRELWRGLLMGLVIAAVPAGATGVYLCFQADMAGAGIALGVAVALAELAIGLIGMKVSARRVWQAMPRVLLWLAIVGLGLLAASAFAEAVSGPSDDPEGGAAALVLGTVFILFAAGLAIPPTRRLLGRLFRWPTVLLLAVLCFLVPFGGGFGNAGAGVGAILVLQLLILELLHPWDRRSTPAWRREYRFPKGYGGARSGATLITTAVAMMLVAMCMTAVMQAYMQGGRAREVQARRTAATAACREAIEGARAHGYGALQAAGEYSFAVRARQPMRGALQIAPGPVPDSKLVTATVTWAADERSPAGSATLTTIMSARGIGG